MKKLLITAVGAMLVGSLSMAADAENAEKATTDVSKNPFCSQMHLRGACQTEGTRLRAKTSVSFKHH